jgi:signal transduction histidine kinase
MTDPVQSSPSDSTPPTRHAIPVIPLMLELLIIVCVAIFAYWTQAGVSNSRNWVLHTYDVRTGLQNLGRQLAEVRGSALAYVGSSDPRQLADFHIHAANIEQQTASLLAMTADNPRQQFRLGELETIAKKYVAGLQDTVSSAVSTQHSPIPAAAATTLRDLDVQEAQLESIVRSMTEDEKALLDTRLATWNRLFVRSAWILTTVLIGTLVLFAYNFRLLTREVFATKEMERLQRDSVRYSRALSARVLELQDAERRRIARELHDSLGQYLIGLKIQLEQLQLVMPDMDESHAKLLNEGIDLAERSIAEVRTISHLLHPPLLDDVGLESAARWYAEGFERRSGLKVQCELTDIASRLPKEVELALFRVLQESLTNVHRHANAKSVDVLLSCGDGQARLEIRDDGRGIPKDVINRFYSGMASGVGLAGMRERLSDLNGRLEVERRSRGSVIRAIIPVAECASSPDLKPVEESAI